mmetsp:Transcript_19637/g.54095  ORF Transcript_19637/g.54095 Transcript_19637/m.54095 type:complete len:502 (+) Transcript_19637:60-1565(+)
MGSRSWFCLYRLAVSAAVALHTLPGQSLLLSPPTRQAKFQARPRPKNNNIATTDTYWEDEKTVGKITRDLWLAHLPFPAMLAATTVFLSPMSIDVEPSAGQLPNVVLAKRTNEAWALSEAQLLVDDVWKEVTRQYVDRSYNGLGEEGWRKKRLDAVTAVGTATLDTDGEGNNAEVYTTIRKMLSALGDPYTRFLTPEQYESIVSYATGTSSRAGIGVQLSVDPRSGSVVVMNTFKDGPAQKAGIQPGDYLLEVNSENVDGTTAEAVAAKCKGEPGSLVTVKVRHLLDEPGKTDYIDKSFDISRAIVQSNKVQQYTFKTDKGEKVGLIRVPTFSQSTESQVRTALDELRKSDAFLLDIRGNAGGYMPAGVDVAKLFLPPRTRIISEIDKTGRTTISINDGIGSVVDKPLYLLVDGQTASASEILTAALQDNHRATVLGAQTFGKGRIQNVQELRFGTGVAVTKAKYITPGGRDIQGAGIQPDFFCSPETTPESCLSRFKSGQ